MSILSPDSMPTARIISAVLIGCSLLILLIACANTANLLLALATLRRQEALIKTALGAPRSRLIGEFLRETAVICCCGGLLGYAIASGVLHWFSHFQLTVPPFGSFPIAVDAHPGGLVVAATVVLICGASLVSGLAPALYASKPNLASALSGEIAIGGTRRSWIRNTVVAVQVAVCTLGLAATGLCVQSLRNLRSADPGFSARKIAAAWIFGEEGETLTPEQGLRRYAEIRRDAAAIPGVESAALASDLPLGDDGPQEIEIRFTDRPDDGKKVTVGHSIAEEHYFETMGIKLLAGRGFREVNGTKSAEDVVINHFMAEKYWPKQDPIGKTFRLSDGDRVATVAGVAVDGKYSDLDEAPRAYVYLPLDRHYQDTVTLIARTKGDPRQWIEPIIGVLKKHDVPVPLWPMTMDEWMNLTLFMPRMALFTVSGLAILAMLLATVGLYGAISYSVRERRRELGIRIALGARPGQVMQLVFRRTMLIAGTGVVLGLGLGAVAGILFGSQLYQIRVVEWRVLMPVAMAMAGVSLAIAYLAARRWTRMNPMDAVRHI